MNLVFSGLHGTGKSTIAKLIAERYHLDYYSTGDAFRELARESGMCLKDFSIYSESHPEIDLSLDEKIKNMAQSESRFVFDGQLPAFLLGDLADFKILLRCEDEVRISRMKLRDNQSYDYQKQETLVREASEWQRFLDLYQIDIQDETLIVNTYDLIVDTTTRSIDEVFEVCVRALEKAFPFMKDNYTFTEENN